MTEHHLTPFTPFEWGWLRAILEERIQNLPPEDAERAAKTEPGSTVAYPPDNGWIRFTVGLADPVELGRLHVSALRRDMTPHGNN